jgi:Protein of unknown function (DUF1761)
MEVEINYLAVLLAAVSSMVVGYAWYAPKVFGDKWAKFVGLNEEKMKKGAPKAMSLAFVASLITAYVLAHVIYLANSYFDNSFMQDALSTALWLWLGLTAARLWVHDLFEQRPAFITAIAAGYELVTLIVMAAIIGWFGI